MKQHLREMLVARDLDGIAQLASRRKRALGILISLTYDEDRLVAWRAVEAMGVASNRVARDNADYVLNILRRLHWLLLEESGGVGWYAPQMIAEIIRQSPDDFSEDYACIVTTLLHTMAEEDLEHFRPGIFWAIGRLAPVAARDVEEVLTNVRASLADPDDQVRGMAVWCLVQAGKHIRIDQLHSDSGRVEVFEDGELRETTVGALATARNDRGVS
jgi:hypothetical protein